MRMFAEKMKKENFVKQLPRKTVGIYGFGRTGRAVCRALVGRVERVVVLDDAAPGKVGRDEFEENENISWEFQPDTLPGKLDLLVVSPGLPRDHSLLKQARGRGIPVLGELELAYRFCRGKIWAITGTNGKSTCTRLTATFLSMMGDQKIEACGNLGRPLIEAVFEGRNRKNDNYVVEVSSFQVEGMEEFSPDNSLLLNLGDDHQDRHSSLEEYHRLKLNLLNRSLSGGRVVLPFGLRGDRRIEHLGTRCELAFFTPGSAGTDKKIKWTDRGLMVDGELVSRDKFPLILRLYPENLMAVLTLVDNKITAGLVEDVLNKFEPLPHRAEEIKTPAPFTVINDSKGTNPAAVRALVKKMDSPFRLILGGGSKNSDFSELFHTLNDSPPQQLNICGEQQLVERLERLAVNNSLPYEVFGDWESAVKNLLETAEPGEMVLLSPGATSFDAFENYRRRGEKFRQWTKEIFPDENV